MSYHKFLIFTKSIIKKKILILLKLIGKTLFIITRINLVICDYSYAYEAQRINELINIQKKTADSGSGWRNIVKNKFCYKKYVIYTFIPKEIAEALNVNQVQKAEKFRKEFFYKSTDLLTSEIIKYVHALDKGLHMPQKRDKFGIEKYNEVISYIKERKKYKSNDTVSYWIETILKKYEQDQKINK